MAERFKRLTTHQMAERLRELPDVPLYIELWCEQGGCEMAVELTNWGCSRDGAIIFQKRTSPDPLEGMTELRFSMDPHPLRFNLNPETKDAKT